MILSGYRSQSSVRGYLQFQFHWIRIRGIYQYYCRCFYYFQKSFFHLFTLQQTTLRDPIHAVASAGILS